MERVVHQIGGRREHVLGGDLAGSTRKKERSRQSLELFAFAGVLGDAVEDVYAEGRYSFAVCIGEMVSLKGLMAGNLSPDGYPSKALGRNEKGDPPRTP